MRVIQRIVAKRGNYKVVALLASAVALLVLPFVRSSLGWFIFVGLLPLFYALDEMQRRHWSKAKIVFALWLSGWVYLLIVTSWILQINTSKWSYIPGASLVGMVIFSWVVCSLVMSTGFALFGWLITKLKAKPAETRFMLIVSAAWVTGEFARSWVTTLAASGPEGSIGAFFNFGNLGFAAANTPLGYTARLVGLYGLSFLVVSVNVCIYWLIKRKWRVPLAASTIMVLITLASFFIYKTPGRQTKHVAAFQVGRSDQRFYENELLNLLEAGPSLISKPADVIALPEYANFFEQGETGTKQTIVRMLTQGKPALYIYSRDKSSGQGLRKNEIVYAYSDEAEISTQEKNFLIPAGEYLPYLHRFILKLIGQDQVVQVFNANTGVAKGSLPEHPVTYNSVSYGALACSGAIAPQLYKNLANQGAEVLINSASLNVFKNSPMYREQSESMIRFSAVATAKPLVQAARGNYAYIFDQNGHTLARSSELGVRLLEADIQPSSKKTLYTRWGEYMVVVSVLILGGFTVAIKRPAKKSTKRLK
jgi:apolipoprotein N-acyltransferase